MTREATRAVFDVIGLTPEEARSQFCFLLDAFKFGPPPHGGIAFGWDRVVMLLAGVETIRDVIAFPKAASGLDPLTGAPTVITAAQRREAGIDAKPAAGWPTTTVGPVLKRMPKRSPEWPWGRRRTGWCEAAPTGWAAPGRRGVRPGWGRRFV